MRSWCERGLIAAGVMCLAWVGLHTADTAAFQRAQSAALERSLHTGSRDRPEGLVGRLEIPRLRLSVMVMEGDDAKTLGRGAGHLRDSALPWEDGNTVITAHRDTFFRPLKDLQLGDEIRLTSLRGTFVYRVRAVRVVWPRDLSVMAPTPASALTLITCYPFSYVGAAPTRFVVSAGREGV